MDFGSLAPQARRTHDGRAGGQCPASGLPSRIKFEAVEKAIIMCLDCLHRPACQARKANSCSSYVRAILREQRPIGPSSLNTLPKAFATTCCEEATFDGVGLLKRQINHPSPKRGGRPLLHRMQCPGRPGPKKGGHAMAWTDLSAEELRGRRDGQRT